MVETKKLNRMPTEEAPGQAMSSNLKWLASSGRTVMTRPDLWPTAISVLKRHAPARWWARRPFLPVPDGEWMDFRFETAFGETTGRPDSEQLIEYLEWSRSWNYL